MHTQEPVKEGDVWYRAEVWGKIDEKLHYEEWYVTAVTPKGMWVSQGRRSVLPTFDSLTEKRLMGQFIAVTHASARHRWFSFGTRFIQRTKEAALQQLIARTAYWVKKERVRLDKAERRYAMLTGSPLEVPLLEVLP